MKLLFFSFHFFFFLIYLFFRFSVFLFAVILFQTNIAISCLNSTWRRPLFRSNASSKVMRHRSSDTPLATVAKDPSNIEKLRSESFPSCSTSTPSKLAASPESSTPTCPYTGAISKLIDSVATTSQDSGINMFFHDPDDPNKMRCTSTTTSMDTHPPLER